MTLSFSILRDGVQHDLSDGATYLLTGLAGLGMPPLTRLTERGPLQHGESDLGFRLRGRRVQMVLMVKAGTPDEWLSRRQEIVSLFRPGDEPAALRVATDSFTRQLDCHFSGGLDMPPSKDFATRWIPLDLELYAPDPTWYDPVGVALVFPLGGGGAGTPVPLTVPFTVGTSSANLSQQVVYGGTWDAQPIITLRGPMTGVTITNTTAGAKLDLSALSIASGEDYVIDCRYGYKTIKRASDGANGIQYLSLDSDLATFAIGAAPNVPGGINSLQVVAGGITAVSMVYVQFHTRFVGI